MNHKHKPDQNTLRIKTWLRQNPAAAPQKLADFFKAQPGRNHSITHLLHSHATKALRRNVATVFNLK